MGRVKKYFDLQQWLRYEHYAIRNLSEIAIKNCPAVVSLLI